MCGIGGIVGRQPPDPGQLARMAQAMAHRGPDAQGTWHDGTCGLAFRRLAIIDLDERSNQPMHLGPLHLAFNGEVYDYLERRRELEALGHRFHTQGDTEVLLHAWAQWGEQTLHRVNAMFAFAVWDDAARELVLAADRFGEKPIYWRQDGDRLVFASDVRALVHADPSIGRPDEEVLAAYLALGTFPEVDASFFEGVHRLPAAHRLRWRAGQVDVERYWTPRTVDVPGRYEDAVDELRGLLTDAIRLRLRSDVPVGTSLSGGVDSSAIVSLSAQLAGDHRRHAFTARFPGYARDEWGYAHAVAQAAGVVEHHAIEPTASELLDDVEALVRDLEEPAASLSVYAQWRVMQRAREEGVTVLLDGQGADELFGGYAGLAALAARSGGPPAPLALRARSALLERLPDRVHAVARRRAASPYVTSEAAAAGARRPRTGAAWTRGRDPLHGELMRQAFASTLPALLRYADRDSMAHSREVRLPFLDPRIAEFACSLPAAHLRRGGISKAILRDAVKGLVPEQVLFRTDKVGFEPPQDAWLADERVRAWAADVLLDGDAGDLVDRRAVEADHRAGRWRDAAGLWRALNAQLWRRAFAASPGPVEVSAR